MHQGLDMAHCFRINRLHTAFDEPIESDFFFVGERHNFWELVFVVSGQVGITAGEDARTLEAGQAALHSPMEFHRVWYAGIPGRILVFSFSADGLPLRGAGRFLSSDPEQPRRLLEQTRKAFIMEGIFIKSIERELEAQLVLKSWEVFLLELLQQVAPVPQSPRTQPAKNYATIVQVLERNVGRNLSVDDIAALCSMSTVSVKQTFSRYAGMGVMNYFNRLKVQAACSMLREGTSVQETAAALGFSSQNYFSTVFKRIQGESPTGYRSRLP